MLYAGQSDVFLPQVLAPSPSNVSRAVEAFPLRSRKTLEARLVRARTGDPIRVCYGDFGCADEQWTTAVRRLCSLMGQGERLF
jgi:hypothetical protein